MFVVCWILLAYFLAFLLRAILSWFPIVRGNGVAATIAGGLMMVTDPLVRPLRRLLRPLRVGAVALDFAPTIVMLALLLVRARLC